MDIDAKKKKRTYSKKKKPILEPVVPVPIVTIGAEIVPMIPGIPLSSSIKPKREKKANAKKPTRKVEHIVSKPITTIEEIKITILDNTYGNTKDIVLDIDNIEEIYDKPSEEPLDEPTEEPIEEPTEEPLDEPAEEPIDEPIEEPIDEPIEEPVDEPIEEPVDEPIEEPIEEPMDILINYDTIDDEILFLDTPDQDDYIYSDSINNNSNNYLTNELSETNKILLNIGQLLTNIPKLSTHIDTCIEPIKQYSNKIPRDLVDNIFMSYPNNTTLLIYGFEEFPEFLSDIKCLFANVIIVNSLNSWSSSSIKSSINLDDSIVSIVNCYQLDKKNLDILINSNYNMVKKHILFQCPPKIVKQLFNYSNNFVLDFNSMSNINKNINTLKLELANDLFHITICPPDIVGKLFISSNKLSFHFVSNTKVKIGVNYHSYSIINKNVYALDNMAILLFDNCFTNLNYIDIENYKVIIASL
jgi:hypothetical protein